MKQKHRFHIIQPDLVQRQADRIKHVFLKQSQNHILIYQIEIEAVCYVQVNSLAQTGILMPV
jgi:hypothetical protein